MGEIRNVPICQHWDLCKTFVFINFEQKILYFAYGLDQSLSVWLKTSVLLSNLLKVLCWNKFFKKWIQWPILVKLEACNPGVSDT